MRDLGKISDRKIIKGYDAISIITLQGRRSNFSLSHSSQLKENAEAWEDVYEKWISRFWLHLPMRIR